MIGAVLALACAPVAVQAQPQDCQGTPSGARLTVVVEGVRSSQGMVVANLYGADKRRFLADNGELHIWHVPARTDTTSLCFWLPAPGPYEVVVFHDVNANRNLDMGIFFPKEAYGFSNNVRPVLSAPSLESARFMAAPGDTTIHIRLRYP